MVNLATWPCSKILDVTNGVISTNGFCNTRKLKIKQEINCLIDGKVENPVFTLLCCVRIENAKRPFSFSSFLMNEVEIVLLCSMTSGVSNASILQLPSIVVLTRLDGNTFFLHCCRFGEDIRACPASFNISVFLRIVRNSSSLST